MRLSSKGFSLFVALALCAVGALILSSLSRPAYAAPVRTQVQMSTSQAAPPLQAGSALTASASVTHGQYIALLALGCGCHTPDQAKPFAGGDKFQGPFGVVYSKNLTPDKATGIGNLDQPANHGCLTQRR